MNSSPLERILAAHEHVTGYRERRTGRGYRITCAVCATASYKGAVTEAENGSVLMHFFCGHSSAEVLDALGLSLADLFPTRDLRTLTPQQRRELRESALLPKWRAALEVLTHEANVLLIVASKMGDGFVLDDNELTRMRIGALKIFDAQQVLAVRHG
ncbi:hypothetical protein [Rhodanobacter sp. DHB23]|uniref:hypothetical protein n=1 Tax=Rhodanobacter sp. DHB23 TaxID=2775923 RepID=UPI00177FD7F0|nr:hypothetical protein [Rhodanobacter sp. DHB23]MBD8873862.1 hypothetical protein [Rhodanobacter sp. DHB23]